MVFLLNALLVSCDASLCSNELINEVISPDRKYVASVFERDCGATVPYIRVVTLRLSNAKFFAEEYDNWVFTIHGQSDVRVSWAATDKLKIAYSGTGDRPTQREKWKNVVISYD